MADPSSILARSRKPLISEPRKRTRAEIRVLIAKDALEGIRLGRLDPTSGTYFEAAIGPGACAVQFEELKDDAKLSDAMSTFPTCQVCALGATFAATVARFKPNTVRFSSDGVSSDGVAVSVDDDDVIRPLLRKYFSATQLGLMETAFEGSQAYLHSELDPKGERSGEGGYSTEQDYLSPEEYELATTAVLWGEQFEGDSDRLRAIFKNVVKNGGEFKPVRPPVKEKKPAKGKKT